MGSFFSSCLSWPQERNSILDRISQRKVPLKVVLKTRNDQFFLARWIEHYRLMVGLEGIVIFDNQSDDPIVESVYESHGSALQVFRFEGFHNDLHRPGRVSGLYEALRASCQHYLWVDTDEFLVHLDRSGRVLPPKAIPMALETQPHPVVPTVWTENLRGEDKRFWLRTDLNHYVSGLRSGKPILSSQFEPTEMMNHNWQLGSVWKAHEAIPGFFLLHLKRLSRDQRIRTNLQKLVAYKILKSEEATLSRVLETDPMSVREGNPRQWFKEIHTLMGEKERPEAQGRLPNGCIEVGQDTVQFGGTRTSAEFAGFFDNFPAFVTSALLSAPSMDGAVSAG